MSTSSLHGKLIGLIGALAISAGQPGQQRVITDHLNSVRASSAARTADFQIGQWRHRPASEFHLWLADIVQTTPALIEHVKAHTDATDDDSSLTAAADVAAKEAHRAAAYVPAPTAYMKNYVPYSRVLGQYLPDTWATNLHDNLIERSRQTQGSKQILRLGICPDRTPISPYYYVRSPAALITKYQFLLRIGAFWTNHKRVKTGVITSPACDYCDNPWQDEEHLFLHCPHFDDIRAQEKKKALKTDAEGNRA